MDAVEINPPNDDNAETDDDGLLVPVPADREWIVEQLGRLVQAQGYEHLVLAALVEPTESFFPDKWAGGEPSATRVAQRLCVYADLDRTVAVTIFEDQPLGPVAAVGPGSNAWLDSLDAHRLTIAVREAAVRDPLVLVPAMARVVAEAWRRAVNLPIADPPVVEQRLIDLTTVYLGFGLLTTDAARRTSSQNAGGFRSTRSKSRLGVLPPQALAFGLAITAACRNLDRRTRRSLSRHLQRNPAQFFAAAFDLVQNRTPPIRETLKIPPPSQWPPAPSMTGLTAPLVDDPGDEQEGPEVRRDEDRGILGMNAGRPVFRVERSKATRLAKMLALPAVLLGVLFNRMQVGIEVEMWQATVVAAGLGALGLLIGRFIPDIRCSEPKCGQPLTRDLKTCPRCGGTISGAIGHPKQRLAAADALEAKTSADS